MDPIIPSNLIDQLIEMSSLSGIFKFLIIHSTSLMFFTLFFLIPFFVTGITASEPKSKHLLSNHKTIMIGAMSPFLILFTTMLTSGFVESDVKI